MKSPWHGEMVGLIRAGNVDFVREHGGPLTNKVMDLAEEQGIFDVSEGLFASIDIRCSFQKAGEFQHKRDAWHYDTAEKGWIYVLGQSPTEFRDGEKVWSAPTGELVSYHKTEHRCPPQTKSGWRYFCRILWSEWPQRDDWTSPKVK